MVCGVKGGQLQRLKALNTVFLLPKIRKLLYSCIVQYRTAISLGGVCDLVV